MPSEIQTTDGDYETGVSDIMLTPTMQGFGAMAVGLDRSANPHQIETVAWQEWMAGFERAENAEWVTINDH